MASLKSIAEQAWRQLFPNPSDETALTLEEVIETAKNEYALQQYYFLRQQRIEDWWFAMPSHLLSESEELEVVEGDVGIKEIDISELKILRSMPNQTWLQNVGGITCECKYIKSTVNQTQLLCGDDSLPELSKTFYILGKKIRFPEGTHAKKLRIIYTNDGTDLNDDQEIDDAIGALVRVRLIEIYGGKVGKEDESNNSNSNS